LYYIPEMTGIERDLHALEELLVMFYPEIHLRLTDLGIPLRLKAMHWFLSFFINTLPTETVLRIIDWATVEGSQVLFRISLALFHLSKDKLLQQENFSDVIEELRKMFSNTYNCDLLITTAYKHVKITIDDISEARERQKERLESAFEQKMIDNVKFTKLEFQDLKLQFQSVVKCGASGLDKEGFNKFLQLTLPHLAESSDILFQLFDKNNDGSISPEECLIGVSIVSQGSFTDQIPMWFAAFDFNDDGNLDNDEIIKLFDVLCKLLQKDGRKTNFHWMHDFFRNAMTKNPGKWTLEEFQHACHNLPMFLTEWLEMLFRECPL